jgi:hypothetical protein
MATKKQIERKKKAREQKGRARVAARRHKMDEAKRSDRRLAATDRRFREKITPIVNDPEKKAAREEADKRRIEDRLQRNMEILKALEEEYERDMAQKKEINERLEAEGHHTLKDKINALEGKAKASMDSEESQTGQIDLTT